MRKRAKQRSPLAVATAAVGNVVTTISGCEPTKKTS
jgi:hypothetical protein